MSIEDLRKGIDALDTELLQLLARRAELATDIARAKREAGLPARDNAREQAMLDRARNSPPAPLTPDAAQAALRALIDSTRALALLRSSLAAPPCRVSIIGLGLIGGSIAKALKASNPAHRLRGVDLAPRLEAPGAAGLFESLHEPADGKAAVADAQAVFLCAAPSVNLRLLPQIRADVAPGAVVSDVGGTKAEICALGRGLFDKPAGPWFVGGHPMAGRALGGFASADPALFADRPWVLTARRNDTLEPLKLLQGLIESTGARLSLLTPEDHDRTVVAVSHLPQLLSLGLMLCAGGRDRGIAGPALRDMTRLAESPAGLWSELLHSRKDLVTTELQRLRSYLSDLEMAVAFGEPLDPWFERAAKFRAALDGPQVAPGAPTA